MDITPQKSCCTQAADGILVSQKIFLNTLILKLQPFPRVMCIASVLESAIGIFNPSTHASVNLSLNLTTEIEADGGGVFQQEEIELTLYIHMEKLPF